MILMRRINSFNYHVAQALVIFVVIAFVTGLNENIREMFKVAQYLVIIYLLISFFVGLNQIYLNKRLIIAYILMAIWSFAYFLSAIMSINSNHGLWIFINTVIAFIILFLFFCNFDKNSIINLVDFLVTSLILFAMLPSFFVLMAGGDWFLPFSSVEYTARQSSGVFSIMSGFRGVFLSSNTLGSILFLISGWLIFKIHTKELKFSNIAFLSISFLMLFLTFSRGSIVSLFVILIVYAGLSGSYLILKLFFVLVLFVGLISLFFGDELLFISERFGSGSLSQRDIIWNDAINEWRRNFLFGKGPNQYVYEMSGVNLSTHNEYLSILVNNGVFVLLFQALLYLVFFYILLIRREKLVNKYLNSERNILISFLVAILFHQFFETGGFHFSYPSGIFLLLIAAYACQKIFTK